MTEEVTALPTETQVTEPKKASAEVQNGDWKTTLSGTISAAAAVVVMTPGHFDLPIWAVNFFVFIFVGGLAGLGITAKGTTGKIPAEGGKENAS